MGISFSHCGRFLAACCGLVNEDPAELLPATDSPARPPIPADTVGASVASEQRGSSGSTTLHNKAWKHDVFLSFRGEDTRRTITSHLHRLLEERGVDVFIDDSLERGEDISSQLVDTIRSSRISVVIFSQNYAESGWCLQELVEIMKCKKTSPGQMVLPVFYDVDPSDVRKQTGVFGEAFAAKHKHNKNVSQWKAALTEAGKLSGWDITNSANGPEAEIVRKIAQEICHKLNNTYLDVGKHMVGLEQRVAQVNEHMNDGSNDVRFVVISGIGGLGKTTLAKEVYNRFAHTFEAKCFLADIGENSKEPDGLVRLQEQLLGDILQYDIKLTSLDRGINVIKERVSSRMVLVILDDLTHRDQMKALAREREWFGSGSRIIITTRDPDTAKEIRPNFVYKLEGLDDDESLRLFSMHSFGSSHPKEGFTELSKRVIGYCKGLPLALEVLGAFLLDRSRDEWESQLRKLRRTPNDDIQKRLEISYDALGRNEKALFLHIACFFVGRTKDSASEILEACEFEVKIGLGILIRRNLVRLESDLDDRSHLERLHMHDLIWDMGKEIVRRESRNPGERSRLFSKDDILTTLRSHLGTKEVEGLVVPLIKGSELVTEVDAKAFAGMKCLRMLQLQSIHVIGDYRHFSKELRWLYWDGFPLESLPADFYMGNLVIMEMRWSKLRALWGTSKILEHLKLLDLSHSHFLTMTPDFSNLPGLEELWMIDCRALKEVDASIGHLKRLQKLILTSCKELESLPDSICRVTSLKTLFINGCSKIKQLPDNFGELSSLAHFDAEGAPIAHLPPSIAKLENLLGLDLSDCLLDLSFVKFGSLVMLGLRECNLADGAILEGIGSLQRLRYLRLGESIFRHLPISISFLPYLEIVVLRDCPELESVPNMPPSVRYLDCSKCPKLKEVSGSGQTLLLHGCHNLSLECRQSILQDWWGRFLVIPGNDMELEYMSPDTPLSFRFCHRCEVHRIFFQCCLRLSNYRYVPTNPEAYLALSSSTRRIGQVELDYFGPGEDNIYIFSFEPEKIMGGREYRGNSVALSMVPNPRVVFKGVKMYFDRERCPSCSCDQDHPSVQEAVPEEILLDEQLQLSVEWSDTPLPGIFSAIGRDVQITINSLYDL